MAKALKLPEVILPEFDAALRDAADRRLQQAQLFEIKTDGDYEAAGNHLKDATAFKRICESGESQERRPLNNALKEITARWRPISTKIDSTVALYKKHIAGYLDQKQAEQRRLQQLADEQARKERERLEKKASKEDAKGNTDAAAAIAQQAAMTVAPVIRSDTPKIAGQSVREAWLFQIEDAALLPREFLKPDEAKIRQFVNAMKADAVIAGVRIYSEKRIASGV